MEDVPEDIWEKFLDIKCNFSAREDQPTFVGELLAQIFSNVSECQSTSLACDC